MGKSNNIGDQIRDAIEDAIASQDYSNLKANVEYSIGVATDAIGRSLRQAAQAAQAKTDQQRAAQALAAQREQECERYARERALTAARFESVGAKKAFGYAAAIVGGVLAFSFAALSLITIPVAIGTAEVAVFSGTAILAFSAAASAVLSAVGLGRAKFLRRFERYQAVVAGRQACSLQELAAQTVRSEKLVLKDVRKMIASGLFKQGHLDDAGTYLMVTDESYGNYRYQLNQAKEQERQKLLEQKNAPRQQPKASLSAEARVILQKGESFIAQIRASNNAIHGAEVSAKIDQIESVVRSIFKRAEEHPEVIGELDRLMDYYLPTTVKLLNAYESLDRQPIQGENIAKSKAEIEATLDTLNVAFAKLLDSIFTDAAWDISTDVSVLHTVLAQEGLVEDPFAKKHPSAL